MAEHEHPSIDTLHAGGPRDTDIPLEPPVEYSESSDVTEKPEQKFELGKENREYLNKRHQFATACFALETYLSTAERPTIEEFQTQVPEHALSDDLLHRFAEIMAEYKRQADQRVSDERRILIEMESANLSKWSGNEPETERVGDFVFERMTGRKPLGAVEFIRKEAYVLMYCEDREDYESVTGEKQWKEAEVARRKKAGDISHEEENKLREGLSSGGRFNHATDVRLLELKLPAIFIHGSPDAEGTNARSMVVHERQHAINQLLDLFAKDEKVQRRVEIVERGHQWIKDEVLAYLRDGHDGTEVVAALRSPLYEHLFKEFPSGKRQGVERLVEKIGEQIQQLSPFLGSTESRAILVYHLIDVPLKKFPKWLEALGAFYDEKQAIYEAGVAKTLLPQEMQLLSDTEVFPSEYRGTAEKTLALQERLRGLQTHAEDLTVLGEAEKNVREMQSLYREVLQTESKLYRRDVHVPVGIFFQRRGADAGEPLPPIAIAARDDILDALLYFPQSHIDEWYRKPRTRETGTILSAALRPVFERYSRHFAITEVIRERGTRQIAFSVAFDVSDENGVHALEGTFFLYAS